MSKTYSVDSNVDYHLSRRVPLHEVLPLSMPISVSVNTTGLCNFSCYYCYHADKQLVRQLTPASMLEFATFKEVVDALKAGLPAGDKIKVMNLAGMGEPLMNTELPQMVAYAKQQDVAEEIVVVTNAALLTHEFSDRLIDAELDTLRISLQGLCAEDYLNTSQAHIDFDRFLEQIQYFYQHKKNTVVLGKIMENMVESESLRKQFADTFEPICDRLLIEPVLPLCREIDYSRHNISTRHSLYGEADFCYRICSRPFYSATIDTNGALLGCCAFPTPVSFGKVTGNFSDLWNSRAYTEFLLNLLGGADAADGYDECRSCSSYKYTLTSADILDPYADALRTKYLEKLKTL